MPEFLLPGIRSMKSGPSSIQKPVLLVSTTLAVVVMTLGPMYLMAQSVEERMLMLLTCMPLSGLTYTWAWQEDRRFVIRWATICFASAVGTWFLFFLFFIFETQDETRGTILVFTNLLTNGILFWMLNKTWRKRHFHVNEEDMVVI
ncbi:MAG: hypothetical protein JWN45_451 [Acidobacteriaceae bacterium]|nr:hypothetical protein [Acidobacteriaceae bacterium]